MPYGSQSSEAEQSFGGRRPIVEIASTEKNKEKRLKNRVRVRARFIERLYYTLRTEN